jgi:hypothetical protein
MTSRVMILLKINCKFRVITRPRYVWCKPTFLAATVSCEAVNVFKHGATVAYRGNEGEDSRILNFYRRWSFVVSLNFLSVFLPFTGRN